VTEQLIELGKAAAAVAAIAGLAILIGKAVRGMLRSVRRLGRMVDEVLGDGDERPGWGKRLASMEKDVAALKRTSATVAAEVRPNGGSSMRDEITRIAEATGATREDKP
jgi:prophage DNA circulation protein